MQSLPWKHTRSHQTNGSSSKAAFGFNRDSRFKSKENALYPLFHSDATPSITSPLNWDRLPLQASEEVPSPR